MRRRLHEPARKPRPLAGNPSRLRFPVIFVWAHERPFCTRTEPEELETRLDDDTSWQIGDLFYRTDKLTDALRTQQWGADFIAQHGNQGPWP